MTLLLLFLLLLIPYALFKMAARNSPSLGITPAAPWKAGLSLLLIITGTTHFLQADQMTRMLPPDIPYALDLIYITGVLEWLGALGLWIPQLVRFTGVGLILMLLAFLPVNIYTALNRIDIGWYSAGPVYLLIRVPFQIFLMLWVAKAALLSTHPDKA